MLDLDLLLTVVGIVLASIGVGVLLLGKSRTDADGERRNVFEAFGIKIDVANPSVLLIMFGVVLMLTPRFLPLGDAPQSESLPPVVPAAPAKPAQPAAPREPLQVTAAPAPEPSPAPQPSSEPAPQPAAQPAQRPAKVPDVVPSPAPPEVDPQVASQAAVAKAAAAARERELAELRAQREAAAREQALLAEQRARLAALEKSRVPVAPPPAAKLPRLAILTEALSYEGESAESFRAKLHDELRTVSADLLQDSVEFAGGNPEFRAVLRGDDASALCKRTQADHLLLADLTPVAVESFTVESANWPNMRYWAVECRTGRVGRSDWMRMEPNRGDRYPLQQSVARSARDFIRDNRHLLQ